MFQTTDDDLINLRSSLKCMITLRLIDRLVRDRSSEDLQTVEDSQVERQLHRVLLSGVRNGFVSNISDQIAFLMFLR